MSVEAALDWRDRRVSAAQAVSVVRPGDRVFVGSGCATPETLLGSLEQLMRPGVEPPCCVSKRIRPPCGVPSPQEEACWSVNPLVGPSLTVAERVGQVAHRLVQREPQPSLDSVRPPITLSSVLTRLVHTSASNTMILTGVVLETEKPA